jgi:hypothetical protein
MCSYESIKSSIRLLLTSASTGLTLEQLNADYQQYNQSKNIPYANFGYRTLVNYSLLLFSFIYFCFFFQFDFVSDMPDIAQFDVNSFPLIVYGVKNNNQTKRQMLLIESQNINDNLSLKSNKKLKVCTFKINKKSSKSFDELNLNK